MFELAAGSCVAQVTQDAAADFPPSPVLPQLQQLDVERLLLLPQALRLQLAGRILLSASTVIFLLLSKQLDEVFLLGLLGPVQLHTSSSAGVTEAATCDDY